MADADTIRILVATDNHVGFEEKDPIRKDDSWKTFDEIIQLARTQDVDMILLAGDLFHDNKPSRKSMYQVMRTLRKNCLGEKPCELQFMSDASQVFEGAFNHVNYEDLDINIAIPVFSIHGNHDDPSGDGHYCSLDLLQVSGLVNFFGRIKEADKIDAKPVMLQKGSTKLALYGLSNVRDERMFRTFREHNVKWFRPGQQSADWFNLLTVHQNHTPHNATNYLPENMLPDWMDLVVWGHEHECKIDPTKNPETGFHVMQPGSSVATSLIQAESELKHVAVLSITGKDFTVEKHRLKTVRPFVMKEISLAYDDRFEGLEKKKNNRQELTRRLISVVDEMIDEANAQWDSLQDGEDVADERPLPLIRLKVETTLPAEGGGQYDLENAQRFSNRFSEKVANTKDVIAFYRKKKQQRNTTDVKVPEQLMGIGGPDGIQIDKLVGEYLSSQSLKILPQAPFGEAVNDFIQKDDKGAMDDFVQASLDSQVRQMLTLDDSESDLEKAMNTHRTKLEQDAQKGVLKQMRRRRAMVQPKPDDWDSDLQGHWEDQPGVVEYDDPNEETQQQQQKKAAPAGKGRVGRKTAAQARDEFEDDEMADAPDPPPITRGRGRQSAKTPTASTPKPTTKKSTTTKPTGRGRKAVFLEDDEDEDQDQAPAPNNNDEDDNDEFMDVDQEPPAPAPKKRATAKTKPTPAAATRSSRSHQSACAAPAPPPTRQRQSKLNFSSQAASQTRKQATQQRPLEISDDEISDDDPFEPMAKRGR